ARSDRRRSRLHTGAARHRVVPEESQREHSDHGREPSGAGHREHEGNRGGAEAHCRRPGADRWRAGGARPVSNPLESWTEEQRWAYLYRAWAEAEAGTSRADLFRRLAGEAEAQAAIWRAQLTASGKPAPRPFVPDARTRLVARMVQLLGPRKLRAVLAAM